jgi:purine-nucleoside phosphorylase
VDDAVAAVRGRDARTPAVGVVLGSGLSGLADSVVGRTIIPYTEIPGLPATSVAGHAGQLVLGQIGGVECALLQGRTHFYEGHDMVAVTAGVRLLAGLGARTLVVTNAAGGINAAFRPGDVMVIRDHIFLPGLAGFHPLRGSNDERLGPRFPAMVGAYDDRLRAAAKQVAEGAGVAWREGVYAMVSGPSYETSAELSLLRALGADAVGMSTCPEVVVARYLGLRVLGLSLIANLAVPEQPEILTHDAVVAASAQGAAAMSIVIRGVLRRLRI